MQFNLSNVNLPLGLFCLVFKAAFIIGSKIPM